MCVGGGAAALGLMRVVLGPSVAEGLQYRAESLRYRAGGGGWGGVWGSSGTGPGRRRRGRDRYRRGKAAALGPSPVA